ncbi:lipoyl synthase [Anoxybacterium hadale]|uniref:Lipoyl synthase n=1 Tax=Anoxybacterium hadale TaxID=3408580 RepID=A0ACD1AF80_9FIRM|nr:lipoyl synthase [Clostridiales bacterium]
MNEQKPDWLKIRVSYSPKINEVSEMLKALNLHTVCQEANCPNAMECFGKRTATFMILGRECTRQCTFCNVSKGHPMLVDEDEPARVAKAAAELDLKHVVVTSVTRDDLPDGGAGHFARVIEEVKKTSPATAIEVLIPDFEGDKEALAVVAAAKPQVINHNIETVKRLYPSVRPIADYDRSLELIQRVKELDPSIYSKSGLMVGLGETPDEVEELLKDLRKSDCDIVTIGQYLAPSALHHPVVEYVTPEQFEKYKLLAEGMGFRHVASSPLVRSSYHAGEAFSNDSI